MSAPITNIYTLKYCVNVFMLEYFLVNWLDREDTDDGLRDVPASDIVLCLFVDIDVGSKCEVLYV